MLDQINTTHFFLKGLHPNKIVSFFDKIVYTQLPNHIHSAPV